MSFYQDQQVRRYSLFLLFFLILTALAGGFLCLFQIHVAETLYLEHSRALASSLLEQGVSKTVIDRALCADAVSPEGSAFLTEIGLGKETSPWLLPLLSRLSRRSLLLSASGFLFLSLLLLLGTFLFFRSRARISKSTTATTSRCSGSCARCRRSKRSLCAPASASIT